MEQLGLSGDMIIIENDTIIKMCETDQDRFIKNISKQKLFDNPHIKAVPIIEEGIIGCKNYAKMPYLKCDNCIVWISKVGLDLIDNFMHIIEQYFDNLIICSELKEFDYYMWITKIDMLQKSISSKICIDALKYLKSIRFTNKFYYGGCHGDLTLSNLFISNDNNIMSIDAIDFLNTFIGSPIQDIVKLRQDTSHFWTINLMKNFTKVDHNRVILMLEYLDKKINDIIQSNTILSEYYTPFQILNLLRIIPYCKEERIVHYLEKEIEGLL